MEAVRSTPTPVHAGKETPSDGEFPRNAPAVRLFTQGTGGSQTPEIEVGVSASPLTPSALTTGNRGELSYFQALRDKNPLNSPLKILNSLTQILQN
jgi:hypothetical protein